MIQEVTPPYSNVRYRLLAASKPMPQSVGPTTGRCSVYYLHHKQQAESATKKAKRPKQYETKSRANHPPLNERENKVVKAKEDAR